jgi:CheY-like chemotaxis protein
MGVSAASPLRVLVIDDNHDSAEAMTLLLELAGHRVTSTNDGPSGIEEARRFRPHVVFCDISMPGGMDGYAVARALHTDAATRNARLVAVTGRVAPADRRRAREAGFAEFLAKPFDGRALLDALEPSGGSSNAPSARRHSRAPDRSH